MENERYINQLHWVFDLPDTAGLGPEVREPTRVMMIYDRTTNVTQFEVLDKGLPKDVREHISLWLHNNSHLCDAVNGLAKNVVFAINYCYAEKIDHGPGKTSEPENLLQVDLNFKL